MQANEFDVLQAPLSGKNIIEASAGTGKTFSISVLVLRLILEAKLPIEQIAMVTFTNAAVAELSDRVRKFIIMALTYVKNPGFFAEDKHSPVKQVVDQALIYGTGDEIELLLKKAAAYLDETSIYTIHGFCSKALTEFAFETDELFETKVITDESEMLNRSINVFWRKNITSKPAAELEVLYDCGFAKENIKEALVQVFRNKQYYLEKETSFKEFEELKAALKNKENQEAAILDAYKEDIIARLQGNTKDEQNVCDFLRLDYQGENPFFTKKGGIRSSLSKKLAGHEILDFYTELADLREKVDKAQKNYVQTMYKQAVDYCQKEIEKYKKNYTLMTQQDLIDRLYAQVVEGKKSELIAEKMHNKYKALFIDEFQDTDLKQYTIFKKILPRATTFFIGDPKQSIYNFRGADLDTYIGVVKELDKSKKYTMDKNFRSNPRLVTAMNEFFDLENPFIKQEIDYIKVQAGNAGLGFLEKDSQICPPISIIEPEDQDLAQLAANQISELLSSGYQLEGEEITLARHSIGVLVRKNSEGIRVKSELSKLNIPAVLKQDNKVLESDAVGEFLFFLQAVIEPSNRAVKKVMLSKILEYAVEDVAACSEERIMEFIEFFKAEQIQFANMGIFLLCQNIISYFKLKSRLIQKNQLRELSNIQQAIEILHRKEQAGALSLEELLSWVNKVRAEAGVEGDEFEERIETDDFAVDIVTIHKSKGLAYDIVVAPFLNLKDAGFFKKGITFKKDGADYFTLDTKNSSAQECANLMIEEENRRLVYVAVTRAKYKAYLGYNDNKFGKKITREGALKPFIDNLELHKDAKDTETVTYFEYLKPGDIPGQGYRPTIEPQQFTGYVQEFSRSFQDISFIESFSSLDSKKYDFEKIDEVLAADEYDKFVFNELKKGAAIGTFLHAIFENVDFSDFGSQKKGIKTAGNANSHIYDSGMLDKYVQLVKHTVNAQIPAGFTLREIDNDRRLTEMEFYIKTSGPTGNIEELLQDYGYSVNVSNVDLQGSIKGFIDLIFEYRGKFYILDWKSNHLGYDIQNYNQENLETVMSAHNYHLQYLFYAVALKRYLQSRGLDFTNSFGGVLYLYLRGLRSGQNNGVYYRAASEIVEVVDELDNYLACLDGKRLKRT